MKGRSIRFFYLVMAATIRLSDSVSGSSSENSTDSSETKADLSTDPPISNAAEYSSSMSKSSITETLTTVYSDTSSASSISTDITSQITTNTTSNNISSSSIINSTESSTPYETRDTSSVDLASSIATIGEDVRDASAADGHASTVAIVLPIIFLLVLSGVAILVYIRYRKKIRWCRSGIEHKEASASDNGFTSHYVTNELELKAEKRASPLYRLTEAPPTNDDSAELQTNTDRPNETRSTVNQSSKTPPTSNDSSKPPPIADRPTETPPLRQKRKTKTPSCQLAYAPPPPDENFMDCIKRHQQNLVLYQKEFDCLPDASIKSSSVARVQENIVKNRYVNILPYDYNRVVLPKKSEGDSDFINASFIDGAAKKNAYISTQGPLTSTLPDFWSMIWNNNSNRILMLTNLEESIRGVKTVKTSKCTQYWPSTVGHSNTYGDIEVKFIKESVELDWTIRTLTARKEGGETIRTVLQYHYTTWPDQDVPHTCTAVLKFHRLAFKSADSDDSSGPVVVHCSAGVGRTGTLIAIDILAERWKETQPRCDVFKCVQNLRQQRMSMVQSVRQYMFIHHSLIQEFRLGISVEQTTQETLEHRLTTEELQEQFRILEATSVISIPHYSVSKSKPKKNRSSTILPSNSLIRFLRSVKEDDNVYINSVPVKGFRESNGVIATQMPFNDTINDFWRLFHDNRCHVIVMLNSDFNDDERYWPVHDDIMNTRCFHIKRTGNGSGLSRDGIMVNDLQIQFTGTYKKTDDSSSEDESSCDDSVDRMSGSQDLEGGGGGGFDPLDLTQWRPVLHLRVTDWPETEERPSDPSVLLDLYDHVIELRDRHPKGPLLVQCMYGAARSGLFCALINILDRVKDQGIVGVFDAVKLIKEKRQQFVPDFEHYDYLHQLVNIYLNKKKEAHTKGVISQDEPTTRQKEPIGQKLTDSGTRLSVAAEGTRYGKKLDDQKIEKDRALELEQEKEIDGNKSGLVERTKDASVTGKETNVAGGASELKETAIIQRAQRLGAVQDSKEPQEKGITDATNELKKKEIAAGGKETKEASILLGAKQQTRHEIIEKLQKTGGTQDTKELPGKGAIESTKELHGKVTNESTKELKDKGTTESTKEPQMKVANESTKEPQGKGTAESTKEPQEKVTNESTKELQEKVTNESTKELKDKGKTESTKKPQGKVTAESAKELEEIAKEAQEKGITADAMERQTTGVEQGTTDKNGSGLIQESQENVNIPNTKEIQEGVLRKVYTNSTEDVLSEESHEKSTTIDDQFSEEEETTKC